MAIFQIGECDWCGQEERDISKLKTVEMLIGAEKEKDETCSKHECVCGSCRIRLQDAVDKCYSISKNQRKT